MAPTRKNAHQKVDEAEAYAHMNALVRSKRSASEEEMASLWFDAEAVVEIYIEAAEARSASLPGARELGEACFWLMLLSGSKRDGAQFRLVVELLTPGRGVELFALLPRVQAFRDAVVTATAPQPKGLSADSTAAHHPTEDDIF